MEFHLDRDIRLIEEKELKSLYSWSLQEFSKVGEKLAEIKLLGHLSQTTPRFSDCGKISPL